MDGWYVISINMNYLLYINYHNQNYSKNNMHSVHIHIYICLSKAFQSVSHCSPDWHLWQSTTLTAKIYSIHISSVILASSLLFPPIFQATFIYFLERKQSLWWQNDLSTDLYRSWWQNDPSFEFSIIALFVLDPIVSVKYSSI